MTCNIRGFAPFVLYTFYLQASTRRDTPIHNEFLTPLDRLLLLYFLGGFPGCGGGGPPQGAVARPARTASSLDALRVRVTHRTGDEDYSESDDDDDDSFESGVNLKVTGAAPRSDQTGTGKQGAIARQLVSYLRRIPEIGHSKGFHGQAFDQYVVIRRDALLIGGTCKGRLNRVGRNRMVASTCRPHAVEGTCKGSGRGGWLDWGIQVWRYKEYYEYFVSYEYLLWETTAATTVKRLFDNACLWFLLD